MRACSVSSRHSCLELAAYQTAKSPHSESKSLLYQTAKSPTLQLHTLPDCEISHTPTSHSTRLRNLPHSNFTLYQTAKSPTLQLHTLPDCEISHTPTSHSTRLRNRPRLQIHTVPDCEISPDFKSTLYQTAKSPQTSNPHSTRPKSPQTSNPHSTRLRNRPRLQIHTLLDCEIAPDFKSTLYQTAKSPHSWLEIPAQDSFLDTFSKT